jgi:hypothetical protein
MATDEEFMMATDEREFMMATDERERDTKGMLLDRTHGRASPPTSS